MRLQGQTMIVTGGNSGIGEAIVLAAAAEGANVVIDYVANPDAAEQVVQKAEAAGGKAVAVEADVSKVDDLHKLIAAAVDGFGRLDVLVNNAGVEARKDLLHTTVEDFDRIMDINLKSAVFGTKFAAERFLEQGGGGLVVNISSIHEDQPMAGNIVYCLSKGGTRMLARTAGVELGAHGIRVVNVAPGAVATPINASEENAADEAKLAAAIPLGRMARPDEIAGVVVFLASKDATYLTATTITVDGGMTQMSTGL